MNTEWDERVKLRSNSLPLPTNIRPTLKTYYS